MSLAFSMQTERRNRLSVISRASHSSLGMEAWDMVAG